MTFTIALLPGDGIGPEVVAQGRRSSTVPPSCSATRSAITKA